MGHCKKGWIGEWCRRLKNFMKYCLQGWRRGKRHKWTLISGLAKLVGQVYHIQRIHEKARFWGMIIALVKEENERVGIKLHIKETKIMASSPITSWEIKGENVEVVTDFLFLGSEITVDGDCSHEIKRQLLLDWKAITSLDSVLKKQRHYSANKGPYSQGYGLPSGHIRLWELDHKEGRMQKNWFLQCGAGEDSWKSLG